MNPYTDSRANPLAPANSRRPFRFQKLEEIRSFSAPLWPSLPAAVAEGERWPKSVHGMSRLLYALLVAVAFAATTTTYGEEPSILLHQADEYKGGGTNQWWLPLSRLERYPRWHGAGKPPVSVDEALKIARKWIARKSGDGDVDEILLRAINADAIESKFRFSFFYCIRFCVSPYLNHITCVVLMDRTVLEPKLLPWREERPTSGSSQ